MECGLQPVVVLACGTLGGGLGRVPACSNTDQVGDVYLCVIVLVCPAELLKLSGEGICAYACSPGRIVAAHVLIEWISITWLIGKVECLQEHGPPGGY